MKLYILSDLHLEFGDFEVPQVDADAVVIAGDLHVGIRGVGDPWSPAYASNLDELVASSGAALWIHGHTHFPVDYRIGKTRVVSNPRGYVGREEPRGFRRDLVLEI